MKTLLSWSSGKDSAWALHILRQTPGIDVVGLLTTITETFDRVSMHGTRTSLLRAQAEAAGLPIEIVPIPYPCPNEIYESRMGEFVGRARAAGIEAIAFGDLFLQDIRAYREARLAGSGLTPLFPLWQSETTELARHMIASGLEARIVTLDPRVMPRHLAGRAFDLSLLDDLPAGVDPCAENGEFHTFACNGPMFSRPIACTVGETVERDGFVFTDLIAIE